MNVPHRPPRRSGFSLVELLTVIAILGIIAAIIVPQIGVLTGDAEEVTFRRNAQNVMSAYTIGSAAGVKWVGGNVKDLVESVATGQSPTDGPFEGELFRCQETEADTLEGSFRYLGLTPNGEMFYDQNGAQPVNGL